VYIDDVIDIKRPESDSQYRLVACGQCKSDNVAYVKYQNNGRVRFRVSCFDCGCTVQTGAECAHDAQVAWNKGAVSA
jgi:uncharacterized protein (UPF0303 family)